jgi:hypothetical protein
MEGFVHFIVFPERCPAKDSIFRDKLTNLEHKSQIDSFFQLILNLSHYFFKNQFSR